MNSAAISMVGAVNSAPGTLTITPTLTSLPHSSVVKPLSSPLSMASASVGEKRRRATLNRKM